MCANEDICRESTNKDSNTISNKPVLPPPDDLLLLAVCDDEATTDEAIGATEDTATELATAVTDDELLDDD